MQNPDKGFDKGKFCRHVFIITILLAKKYDTVISDERQNWSFGAFANLSFRVKWQSLVLRFSWLSSSQLWGYHEPILASKKGSTFIRMIRLYTRLHLLASLWQSQQEKWPSDDLSKTVLGRAHHALRTLLLENGNFASIKFFGLPRHFVGRTGQKLWKWVNKQTGDRKH